MEVQFRAAKILLDGYVWELSSSFTFDSRFC